VVDGVAGHPGALLAGWADGACARVRIGPAAPKTVLAAEGTLAGLIGADLVTRVAWLAYDCARIRGDTAIEWAVCDDGTLWLLQAQAAGPAAPAGPGERLPGSSSAPARPAGPAQTPRPADQQLMPLLGDRALMPLVGEQVQARGDRVPGRPAAPGQAAGRLVACRPHERRPAHCRDAILLVDRPVPALAPLLFAARGVIARAGAAGSHLAEVARSLAVPMVTGCHPEAVTGPAPHPGGWLAAIDGSSGEVWLLPG
jgi:phosphohistidine swiveling domain-containing protein